VRERIENCATMLFNAVKNANIPKSALESRTTKRGNDTNEIVIPTIDVAKKYPLFRMSRDSPEGSRVKRN
jgi:hypothetical protein